MDIAYVRNYLIANGKYFPSDKLGTLGRILEESQVSEHIINKRFFGPVFITILFWVFWPFQLFDRLLLKDWFWGWLKLLLPLVVGFILYKNSRSPFQVKGVILEGYDLVNFVSVAAIVIWALWTIVDGFTIYARTKKANYRAVLRALGVSTDNYVSMAPTIAKNSLKDSVSNESYMKWRKENPSLTINDYYKRK